ncbi:uncharacterized protein EI90DRAFT_3025236 [Cantharellus anzutake]|uniref:uncharacterized protein n=1 Tax=Cantharellus anzutake TaxID=1750568 RepID=UPI001902E0F0|nr:uncharacterized protein EI90DRAFT_3025236 [Cantharellus anzutake]KAF8309311.1 hypothetical protein EI90DRAFT_3025236 [Cantharellus anzutake]
MNIFALCRDMSLPNDHGNLFRGPIGGTKPNEMPELHEVLWLLSLSGHPRLHAAGLARVAVNFCLLGYPALMPSNHHQSKITNAAQGSTPVPGKRGETDCKHSIIFRGETNENSWFSSNGGMYIDSLFGLWWNFVLHGSSVRALALMETVQFGGFYRDFDHTLCQDKAAQLQASTSPPPPGT